MTTNHYPKGMRVVERLGAARPRGNTGQEFHDSDAEIISEHRTARGRVQVLTDTGRYYDGVTGMAVEREPGVYRCIVDPAYTGHGSRTYAPRDAATEGTNGSA